MKETKQTKFIEERNNLEDRIENIDKNRSPLILILDSTTDPRNVGSIFRIADAARISHIYFYNCSLNLNSRHFKKTARSCDKYLNFSEINLETIKKLKQEYKLIAVDKTTDSQLYSSYNFVPTTALIFGSEKRGVSKDLLSLCDNSVHIPMLGINTSLNVANAAAIVIFEAIRNLNN